MIRRDLLRAAVTGAIATAMAGRGRLSAAREKNKRSREEEPHKFYTIDAYGHFSFLGYLDLLERLSGRQDPSRAMTASRAAALNPEVRLKAMDESGVDATVLIPGPFIESAPGVQADPVKASQAARFINDETAKLAAQYPKRFLPVALLPTSNAEVMLSEFERAVTQLHMVGACIVVSPVAKPPDHPDYMSLYAKAADLDVPVWIHPGRPTTYADYAGESESKYQISMMLGWPMDSSVGMCRIAFSGVFDKHPELKIIIHHRGGLIPLLWSRIVGILTVNEKFMTVPSISKPYVKHLKRFYCDTASSGHEPELLRLAYDFFGPDHVLYGTDSPNDGNGGITMTNNARYDVEHMGISDAAMKKVFSENLLRIMPPTSMKG